MQDLTPAFFLADGLGSITELTDSTGATVRSYLYDSFGQLANQTGTFLNPYTYTSREYDPEANLLYYRARTYDPRIGRFLQEDPESYVETILADSEASMLSQPALGHAYIYALNNPINLTDPDGRNPLLWGLRLWSAVRQAAPVVRAVATRAAPIVRQAATRAWQRTRAVAHSAFRPGGWVNRGPTFRIGWGQHQGRYVFRAAGNVVKRVTRREHINLWWGRRL